MKNLMYPILFFVLIMWCTIALGSEVIDKSGSVADSISLEFYDEPPVPLTPIVPVYPEEMRRAGIEGIVVLELAVLKDGTVYQVTVRKQSHIKFAEAATEAVREMKFKPGMRDGHPVDCLVIVPIEFTLRD